MNETNFEAVLKAVAAAPEEPSSLDRKVAAAVHRAQSTTRVRRRVVWSLAGTCAVGVGLVLLPAVKAEASLHGILSAMDQAGAICMTTYSVDAQGHQTPFAKAVISHGDEWYQDGSGFREYFEIGEKTYTFDPTVKAYILRERTRHTSLKLSELLGAEGGFSLRKKVNMEHITENGRAVIRATIENTPLPERLIITADAKTELPISGESDSLERGTWRKRQVMTFAYGVEAKIPGPDLKKYRVISSEEAQAEFNSAMERKSLASVSFKKGRLVVRDIQVAQDGTVFIAYQSGNRSSRSWDGYALNLKDSLGTPYVRVGQFGNMMEGPFDSPDGKVELETFTPPKPLDPTIPRTFTITTQTDPDGRFTRMMEAGVRADDGTVTYHWQPNYRSKVYGDATVVPVMTEAYTAPTCGTHPSWAETLDFQSYGNDPATGIAISEARGESALKAHQWEAAEAGFEDELRFMREHEQKGYGPWDQSRPMDKLDQARKHVVKPQQ